MEAMTTNEATTNDKLGLGLKDGEASRVTTGKSMGVLSTASQQWYTRPDDERYTSLDELCAFLKARRERSRDSSRPETRASWGQCRPRLSSSS